MLASLGYRVAEIDLVSDHCGGARSRSARSPLLLGHPERGEAMVRALDAARARLAAAPRPQGSTALLVERGGYVEGPKSLAATLLAEAGLQSPGGGPSGYRRVHVAGEAGDAAARFAGGARPVGRAERSGLAVSSLIRRCARFIRRPGGSFCPTRYTLCGGPALIAALDYLADALKRLAAAEPIGNVSARHTRGYGVYCGVCRAHSSMIATSASSPSVSAAGPGCKISGDLISRSQPSRTAGMCRKARTRRHFRRDEFLAAPGADDDVRACRDHVLHRDDAVLGVLAWDSAGNVSMPPAISISSDTQRMPEIIGSSHSSK